MGKKNKYRFIGILVISLAILVLLIFFAMRRIGGGGFSFSREERFFLNGTLNKPVGELTSVLGEPDYITEYSGTYGYRDFKLAGMIGVLEFNFRNGNVSSAHWTLGNINVDDYWPQINKLADYFNKNYNQIDTWDWRKGNNNAYIIGMDVGYYIRVLFE